MQSTRNTRVTMETVEINFEFSYFERLKLRKHYKLVRSINSTNVVHTHTQVETTTTISIQNNNLIAHINL